MNPNLKNIIALVAGIVIGAAVNMGIVNISGFIIPPPEGADLTTMEGVKAAMPHFETKHFLMPFLAHAIGTLAGASITAFFAAGRNMRLSLIVGLVFFAGGAMAVYMLPEAPVWFDAVDLILAYFPMAFLGAKFFGKSNN